MWNAQIVNGMVSAPGPVVTEPSAAFSTAEWALLVCLPVLPPLSLPSPPPVFGALPPPLPQRRALCARPRAPPVSSGERPPLGALPRCRAALLRRRWMVAGTAGHGVTRHCRVRCTAVSCDMAGSWVVHVAFQQARYGSVAPECWRGTAQLHRGSRTFAGRQPHGGAAQQAARRGSQAWSPALVSAAMTCYAATRQCWQTT